MEIVGILRFRAVWLGKALGQQKAPRERGLVIDLVGFYLVAGAGFEPATFRL